MSAKKLRKFKNHAKELTRRKRGASIQRRLGELRRCFQGWLGYFRYRLPNARPRDLNKWVRRRTCQEIS